MIVRPRWNWLWLAVFWLLPQALGDLHCTALHYSGYCHIGWLMCFLCRWWWIPGVGESVPLGGVLLLHLHLHLHLHLQVLRRRADGHSDYPSVLFADPGPRSAGPTPSPLRPKRPEADGVKGDTDMQVSRADPISKRPQGTWLLLLSSLTSRHAHISVCSDRLFIPVMLLHDLVRAMDTGLCLPSRQHLLIGPGFRVLEHRP